MTSRSNRRRRLKQAIVDIPEKNATTPDSSDLQPSSQTPVESVPTTEQRLTALETELKDKQPWYRTPPVLISLVALLFSFGTTGASFYRTSQQDVHDVSAELRGFVQRLIAIPKEGLEQRAKYNDFDVQQQLGILLNNEFVVIARQAAAAASKIPGHVSTTEYGIVADAFINQGNYSDAEALLNKAIAAAQSSMERTQARRRLGAVFFTMGKPQEARAMLSKELSTLKAERNGAQPVEIYQAAEIASTWATGEFDCGNYREGEEQAHKGIELTKRLPISASRGTILTQLLNLLRKQGTARMFAADFVTGRRLLAGAIVTPDMSPDRIFVLATNAMIEMDWARAEIAMSQCHEALSHATRADEIVQQIPDFIPNLKVLQDQLHDLKAAVAKCGQM